MSRFRQRFWPAICDAASSKRAVDRAVRVVMIWALINIALGVIAFLPSPGHSGDAILQGAIVDHNEKISGFAFLLFGLFYLTIARKIRAMSRAWTLGGAILTGFTLLLDFGTSPSPIALIAIAVVLLYFVNALRGVLFFDRMQAELCASGSIDPR
jgi:hypothetical protein